MGQSNTNSTVFVIETDAAVRQSLAALARSQGWAWEAFDSAERFLEQFDASRPGCLLLDLQLEGMRGLELQEQLACRGSLLPVIFLSTQPELALVVRAMKAGAFTILEASSPAEAMVEAIQQALERDQHLRSHRGRCEELRNRVARLDSRERHVWHLVVGDQPNKAIARTLGVSQRTVDRIRATVFAKLGVQSAVQATRMAMELEQPHASNGSQGSLNGHATRHSSPVGHLQLPQ